MATSQKYSDWENDDLIRYITNLEKRKKFGLVWDEKREPEKVILECKLNYPILKEIKEREINENSGKPTHILIEGDNYHALSILNFTHEKSIDVIYIDPPFNTGSISWRYNNKYIDKEDLFRHSKWSSFMYNRLKLAKNLLKPSGIIICAIDDYEGHNLRHILDEIFFEDNRLGTVVVIHNPGGRQDDKFIATSHEYMLIYAKNKELAKVKHLEISEQKMCEYIHEDEYGKYKFREFRRSGSNSRRQDRPRLWYPIYAHPETLQIDIKSFEGAKELFPIDPLGIERVWRWNQNTLMEKLEKYIEVRISGEDINLFVKERESDNKGEKPKTFWNKSNYSAVNGTNEIKKILGAGSEGERLFDYPKSPYLLEDILKITSDDDGIILDFFAGSGTTGQAVLELNKKTGSKRQFILCTNNEVGPKILKELKEKGLSDLEIEKEGVCNKVCYPRIKKILIGYSYEGKEKTLIYEKKITVTNFKNADDILEEVELLKIQKQNEFQSFNLEVSDSHLKLFGSNDIKEKKEGYKENLKYYKTSFAPATTTDRNKENFVNYAVEMLCLRENTFNLVIDKKTHKIFKNDDIYTCILFDQLGILALIKKIESFDKPASVYVFSLGEDDFAEDFQEVRNKVNVCSIPDCITKVYRRIFK